MPTMKRITLCAVCVLAVVLAAGAGARAGEAGKSPVKVFILVGQSNMQGHGHVGPAEKKHTLTDLVKDPKTAAKYKHLVDADGKWVVRKDVWFYQRAAQKGRRGAKPTTVVRKGGLTVGFGATAERIGPELQFGHAMGDALEEQILLIKTAWGGKSLGINFRPPSSGEPTFEIKGDKADVGKYYRLMLSDVKTALADLKKNFPYYDGRGYEVAGLFWHQGWNDGCNANCAAEYEKNMVNFIADVRKDLGVKGLPVVIATSGFGGHDEKLPGVRARIKKVVEPAQIAAAAKAPNTACVKTRGFHRPREQSPGRQSYHWNNNPETYCLIGDAAAKAMLGLLKEKK